jgi:hypothetical protein
VTPERGESPPLEHERSGAARDQRLGFVGDADHVGQELAAGGELRRRAGDEVTVATQLRDLGALPHVRTALPRQNIALDRPDARPVPHVGEKAEDEESEHRTEG